MSQRNRSLFPPDRRKQRSERLRNRASTSKPVNDKQGYKAGLHDIGFSKIYQFCSLFLLKGQCDTFWT